jgi:hypothetical protein
MKNVAVCSLDEPQDGYNSRTNAAAAAAKPKL